MNFFEAQDFFKNMYPGKSIKFEFDKKCIRVMEIIHTDGKPNPVHHIEYQKVKVIVDGSDPVYVPIMPHRMNCDWEYVKEHINTLSNP
jgi:hypothetical protein